MAAKLRAAAGPWVDNVARFTALQADYPEAHFSFRDNWFYGALRDADDVLRADDLGRLIDALTAREQAPDV